MNILKCFIIVILIIIIFSGCCPKSNWGSNVLCSECRDLIFTTDIGECSDCGGSTSSGAFELCASCACKSDSVFRSLQDKVRGVVELVFLDVELNSTLWVSLIPPDPVKDKFPVRHRDVCKHVIPIGIRLGCQRNPLYGHHHLGEARGVHAYDPPRNRASGKQDSLD